MLRRVRLANGPRVYVDPDRVGAIHEEEQEARIIVRRTNATDYTTRKSGTKAAGCLTTDSVWNVSLRKNAVDTALIPMERQDDYLRRLRRSTISRYRSGSRRLR